METVKFVLLDKKKLGDKFLKYRYWFSGHSLTVFITNFFEMQTHDFNTIIIEDESIFYKIKDANTIAFKESDFYMTVRNLYIIPNLSEVALAKMILKSTDHFDKNVKFIEYEDI